MRTLSKSRINYSKNVKNKREGCLNDTPKGFKKSPNKSNSGQRGGQVENKENRLRITIKK